MKKALMTAVIALAATASEQARAQDRQMRLTDGTLMSWGTATMGSNGGALVKFLTTYANPPVVVLTTNAGATAPSSAAPYAAVVWKVYGTSFVIKTDTPGATVNYMALGK